MLYGILQAKEKDTKQKCRYIQKIAHTRDGISTSIKYLIIAFYFKIVKEKVHTHSGTLFSH
jgi:hypothetical protein